MKKIVCELCECTEFTKDGGVFVCQGCGTSYTLEEAKGMMKEFDNQTSPTPMSKTATSSNSNQQQIDNLRVLANNAFEACNNKETEDFCNKIIELDVTDYRAWLLKGKAIGWQSTYGNPRVIEGAKAMRKAVDFAPESEKEDVARDAIVAIKNICIALHSLAKKNFSTSPTKEERDKFFEFGKLCGDATDLFNDVSYEIKNFSYDQWLEQKREMARHMNTSGVEAISFVREKWNAIDYPNDDSLTTYLDWFGEIENIFRNSIENGENAGDSYEDLIVKYKNLIIALEEPINKSSYSYEWNSFLTKYEWVKSKSLTASAINSRKNSSRECSETIADLQNKIKERDAAAQRAKIEAEKKRVEEYWELHHEEKEKLDNEKNELEARKQELQSKITDLNEQLTALNSEKAEKTPTEAEIYLLHEKIKALNERKSSLGLFAGKEKKQIAEEIAENESKISSLEPTADEERKAQDNRFNLMIKPIETEHAIIKNELSKIENRVSQISFELSRAPEN